MRAMTRTLCHTFFGLGLFGCLCLTPLSGCDRDPAVVELPGDGGGLSQQEGCPAAKPIQGASCVAPPSSRCDYFKEASHCNYSDLYHHCTCEEGGWSCHDDFEDCFCPDSAPEDGDVCSFPGVDTCDYTVGGGRDGGPGAIKHCTCDGKSWKCVMYIG